jgi:hypothetical protein
MLRQRLSGLVVVGRLEGGRQAGGEAGKATDGSCLVYVRLV